MTARIFVIAGVNGAGKSSIAGEAIRMAGRDYFNPDEAARGFARLHPRLSTDEVNGLAWTEGFKRLQRALKVGDRFRFETTLGGTTMTNTLLTGAQAGAEVHIWFAGLESAQAHIDRVRSRVEAGGHPIPAKKIRARFSASRKNLVALMPHLASLRVYDNSLEADPKQGKRPKPRLMLHMEHGAIVKMEQRRQYVPNWVKPILLRAMGMQAARG